MKVALISEWLDTWRGGAETSTLQFLHHLMDAGTEVHVFTRSRPASAPGLVVNTIPGATMSRTRQSVTFAHRVERLLRVGSFDVVHAISPCRGADIYQPRGGTVAENVARNLATRDGVVARAIKRGANALNLKQRYMLTLEREIFTSPGGPVVIAISDYVARQLKEHYDVPDARIRRIYNGVNPDRAQASVRAEDRSAIRREFGIAAEDVLALVVAHNFRLKGVRQWLQAIRHLKREAESRVRSLVIGKGDSAAWHRLVKRWSLSDRFAFVGPSDRVNAFYHASDILVHPTFYDPCSRVVLEAMSAGLAVITTQWDGASEIVADGISGFVVDDPTDVAVLADRVMQLCDETRRKAMGESARGAAKTVDMERHAAQVLALYAEISVRRSALEYSP